MRRNYPLLAGLALVTILLSPITASAAQTAPNPSLISDTSTVQTVQYWGDRYRDRGWGYDGYYHHCRVWQSLRRALGWEIPSLPLAARVRRPVLLSFPGPALNEKRRPPVERVTQRFHRNSIFAGSAVGVLLSSA